MLRLMTGVAALALAIGGAGAARAGEQVKIAPPSAWVKPTPLPNTPASAGMGAIQFLLQDVQTRVAADGGEESYAETAYRFLTPESLGSGNVQLPWNPELGDLIVHKLQIIRGGQVIDVLKTQSFTVLRRETNLERATLDGALTAALQPEGLQVGDVLDLALTVRSHDPALKSHAEVILAPLNNVDVERVHLRAVWPKSKPIHWRQTEPFGAFRTEQTADGDMQTELTLEKLKAAKIPEDAPARFRQAALLEGTDFVSWADLSALMAGLYEDAAALKPDSPLKAEAAKIKAASADPKARATAALKLVEGQVRYLFLGMNDGGLKPAAADLTWSRRFGDCKGKTVLLLSLLHELDIPAEPAVVSTVDGDGLDTHLPQVSPFDHVMVRATVGGKVYWMDATRAGDRRLDDLTPPNYRWALPIRRDGAKLEPLVVAALAGPQLDKTIRIDASAGIEAPAPAHLEAHYTGEWAAGLRLALANATVETTEKLARTYWTDDYTWFEPKTSTVTVDDATGDVRFVADGTATMVWEHIGMAGRRFDTDIPTIGWNADFHREPGPKAAVPYSVGYPNWIRRVETVVLPDGGKGFNLNGSNLDVTIAARRLQQKVSLDKGVFRLETSAQALAPEFPASEAPAAQARLRELNRAYVNVYAANYTPTAAETALAKAALTSSGGDGGGETFEAALQHGFDALRGGRLAEATGHFDTAVRLQPQSAVALASRGQARLFNDDEAGGLADLNAALKLDPDHKGAILPMAGFYMHKNESQKAIAVLDGAVAKNPKDPDYLLARIEAESAGNKAAALKDVETLATLLPNDPRVRAARLEVYWDSRDFDGYLKVADDWLKQSPYDADAMNIRAVALAKLKRRDEALRQYNDSLALKPTAMAYAGRAELRPDDQMDAALADVDAALKLDANYNTARNVRYLRLVKAGRVDDALAGMDAWAKDQPTNPIVLNNICNEKAIRNRALESALAQCDAALKITPDAPFILDSRGFVKLRMGRLEGAIADYDSALKKRPFAESYYGRGIAKLRKGDRAGGRADLEQARKLKPTIDDQFKGYGVTPPA